VAAEDLVTDVVVVAAAVVVMTAEVVGIAVVIATGPTRTFK